MSICQVQLPFPDAVEGVGGGGGEIFKDALLGEDGAALKAQGQEGSLLAELAAEGGHGGGGVVPQA